MKLEDVRKIMDQHLDICKAIGGESMDNDTLLRVAQVLILMDANSFKEINQDARFDFTDVPVPTSCLQKSNNFTEDVVTDDPAFSKDVKKEIHNLLKNCNTKGQNREFGMAMIGDISGYFGITKCETSATLQSVEFDNKKIEELLQANNFEGSKFSLFHTHPNEFGELRPTLYNAQTEDVKNKLQELGVKPKGLNVSVSDINGLSSLDAQVKQLWPNVKIESTILMHDGNMITLSLEDGIKLSAETTYEMQNEVENSTATKVFKVPEEELLVAKKESGIEQGSSTYAPKATIASEKDNLRDGRDGIAQELSD